MGYYCWRSALWQTHFAVIFYLHENTKKKKKKEKEKKKEREGEREKLFNPHSLKINKKWFDDIIYIQIFEFKM